MPTLLQKVLLRKYKHIIRHTQVSRNYGRLGGWLRVDFWCFPNGHATGMSESRVFYPEVTDADPVID